jgi:predicted dehydrogenase
MGVRPYRVLVIGCGRIAGLVDAPAADGAVLSHAQAYSRDNRFTIEACVDPDADHRARFMKTWNIANGFADVESAFAGGRDYDVVSICASTVSHAALLHDLVARPVRAIFAEKPVLASLAEKDVIDRYRKPGAPVAVVNYTRRFDPQIAALREEIANGAGPCRSATVFYNKGFRNNGSHAVHLLSYLLDLDPRSFSIDAVGRWKRDHVADDPTVDTLLSAPQGTQIHFAGLDARDYAIFEMTLAFPDRVIEIRDGGDTIRTRVAAASERFPDYRELKDREEKTGGYGKAFPRALDNIADCLEGKAAPACGLDDAVAVETFCQSVIDAALKCPDKEIRI